MRVLGLSLQGWSASAQGFLGSEIPWFRIDRLRNSSGEAPLCASKSGEHPRMVLGQECFDESGKSDEFAFCPPKKTRVFVCHTPESDENDANGGRHLGKGMVYQEHDLLFSDCLRLLFPFVLPLHPTSPPPGNFLPQTAETTCFQELRTARLSRGKAICRG